MRIRIGTRGSELALLQSNLVAAALDDLGGAVETELVLIKTTGDQRQGTPDEIANDKRKWIYELELALLDESVDLAVHSAKDVPSDPAVGTELLPVLKRADAHDVLIGKKNGNDRFKLATLPQGSRIGTASLRRKAQLLRLRPDCSVIELRGNVNSRIKRLDQREDLQGIVLASAGLIRLGMDQRNFEELSFADLLPAVNQGMLVVQYLKVRKDLESLVKRLVDPANQSCFEAERSCVATLKADCYSCVAVMAELEDGQILLRGRVLAHDGRECLEELQAGPKSEAWALGQTVGDLLNAKGAQELLAWGRRNN